MKLFSNKWMVTLALSILISSLLISACTTHPPTTTHPTAPTPNATSTPPVTPTDYPNKGLLVDTKWLKDHVGNANLVIIDTRADKDYAAGHIPSSINLAPGLFDGKNEKGDDTTVLKSVTELSDIFGKNGVSNKAKIVVYSAGVDANAGRVFWALEYLGHKDVHILDGGYAKWTGENISVVTYTPVTTATTFNASSPNASVIATKSYVVSSLNNTKFTLVDSRNAVDWAAKRIPDSINILMGDYLNANGTVKSYGDLTTFLASKGITPGKTIIANCYTGHRSAQGYFIYRLMGYNVSNYDGSTTEWFADTSLKTEP